MRISRVARIGILIVCLFVLLIVIQIIQVFLEGLTFKIFDLISKIIQTTLIGLVTAFIIIKSNK